MAMISRHAQEFRIETTSKSRERRWLVVVGVLMLAGMPVGSVLGVKPPESDARSVDRTVSAPTTPVERHDRAAVKDSSSIRRRSIRNPHVDIDKINRSLSKGRVVAVEPPLKPSNAVGGFEVGLGGSYTGGALCDSAPLPCGVCNDFSAANCQIVDPTQLFPVYLSDLSGPGGTTTTADDFKPQVGNTLNKVCVCGAYLDPEDKVTDDGDAVADCTDEVADNFRVTVYADGGGDSRGDRRSVHGDRSEADGAWNDIPRHLWDTDLRLPIDARCADHGFDGPRVLLA